MTHDIELMEPEQMTSELATLTKEFNAPKDVSKSITSSLEKFFQSAKEHEDTIDAIKITSPDQTDKMQLARTIRLQIRQKRLEAKKIMQENRDRVKAAMASYTLEDKLWLKAFQMLEAVCDNLETKAEEKEKFAERWEAEQKAQRTENRLDALLEFAIGDIENYRSIVADMTDDVFSSYLNGLKAERQAKIEADRKAEQERIAREKAEAEERERVRKENERLRKEAEERERAYKAEQERQRKEREEAEAKARKERMEIERKAEAERRKHEEALAKERAERERLQREQREREAAEEKRLEEERKEQERKAKAPDKQKLMAWVRSFEMPDPPSMKSDKMELTKDEIKERFQSFKAWAHKLAEVA